MEKQALIDALNEDLAGELQAVIQYLIYSAKVTGPWRPQLVNFMQTEVQDELLHAQFLADKIAYDPTSPHGGEYLPTLRAAPTLDDAALIYLDFLLDNGWRYGWVLHPNAVAAYRDLTGRAAR